jgi:hypothetical protein
MQSPVTGAEWRIVDPTEHFTLTDNDELVQALSAVAEEVDIDERDVYSVQVKFLASGEVTYRVHFRGQEEYEGGVFSRG